MLKTNISDFMPFATIPRNIREMQHSIIATGGSIKCTFVKTVRTYSEINKFKKG